MSMVRLTMRCGDGDHADEELRFDVDDPDIGVKVGAFLGRHLQRHGPHDITVEEQEGTWLER